MVVAIYTHYFSDLYRHLAERTGTRAGIFLAGPPSEDAVLARLGADPSSEQLISQLNIKVLLGSSGSGVLDEAGEARLASWAASERFPPLFAASSETLSDVLATWKTQALELTGLGLFAVTSFGAFLLFASRASRARAAASRNELLLREVHHRVKNNLQLVSALVDMRARRVIQQETRAELEQVKTHVMAFANVYEILQISPELDQIEFSGLLKSLCTALETGSGVKLSVATEDDLHFAPQIVLSLCIICNECSPTRSNMLVPKRTSAANATAGSLSYRLATMAADCPKDSRLPRRNDLACRWPFVSRPISADQSRPSSKRREHASSCVCR